MFSLLFVAALTLQVAWVNSHHCAEGDHYCPTPDGHYCVPSYWVCDGYNDCEDQSDEINCSSANCTTPEKNGFWCENAGICIPGQWKCDGDNDCQDWSDESEEMCPSCSEHQFSCDRVDVSEQSSPFCIYKWRVCDGVNDCYGAEDEANCTTITPSKRR